MRAVVQRVTSARVRVGDRVTGEIGRGLLVLVGIARNDTADDVAYIAAKIRDMRVFPSAEDKPMDLSVLEGFFKAFADNARCNVHVDLLTGRDFHHGAEAVFKSFARALRQAVSIDPNASGIPSTKGLL